ncbi:MAG: DUF3298 domain-containing protein [Robiginitalea sp.]
MRTPAYLFMLLMLAACQHSRDINLEPREYSGSECETCPSVHVSIFKATGNGPLEESVNTAQREEIIALLDYDEETDARDIPGAIKAFQDGFRKIQEEFPEELTSWEASVKTTFAYSDAQVVCLQMETYVFTGGAHGYSATRYLNFDRKSGKEIDGTDLFKDPAAFTDFVEKSFRQQYEIPSDAPINSTGFMFAENQFSLPQNIGFNSEGMVLHYNPYEAASYADGALVLEFPLKAIRPFLAWEE